MKRYNFSQKVIQFDDMSHPIYRQIQIVPGPMTEGDDGEWVRYSDHEAALALALANTVDGKLSAVLKMLEAKK